MCVWYIIFYMRWQLQINDGWFFRALCDTCIATYLYTGTLMSNIPSFAVRPNGFRKGLIDFFLRFEDFIAEFYKVWSRQYARFEHATSEVKGAIKNIGGVRASSSWPDPMDSCIKRDCLQMWWRELLLQMQIPTDIHLRTTREMPVPTNRRDSTQVKILYLLRAARLLII